MQQQRTTRVKVGGAHRGPTDIDGLPIGSLDDQFDVAITVALEDYWDEKGDYAYRPSQDEMIHPNGRGRVQKRILQASLMQEMRALDLIVKVVKSRSNKYMGFDSPNLLHNTLRAATQQQQDRRSLSELISLLSHQVSADPWTNAQRVVQEGVGAFPGTELDAPKMRVQYYAPGTDLG
eukprot:2072293-Rhodomonas_salina.2